ncbi:MAG: hypothetical protein RL213_1459 [Bacteroidota bacterium]|jgi:uncharacterized protein (TIGR02453 family)
MNPSTLAFLKDLKKHNDRDWFEANRERYEAARQDVATLTEGFISGISKKEPAVAGLAAKDCVFRIYRDVRFSKNKSPYKTNMGAYVSPGGKKSTLAGFYLHIEPDGSFLAGGIWMPEAEALRRIRQEIDYNGNDLKKILNGKKFKEMFGGFDPEYKLKTTPKNYSKDHPDIELLKHTSFICWSSFDDKTVVSKDFVKTAVKTAELLVPLNRFLNVAVSG